MFQWYKNRKRYVCKILFEVNEENKRKNKKCVFFFKFVKLHFEAFKLFIQFHTVPRTQ